MATSKKPKKIKPKSIQKNKILDRKLSNSTKNKPIKQPDETLKEDLIRDIKKGVDYKSFKKRAPEKTIKQAFTEYLEDMEKIVTNKKLQLKELDSKITDEKKKVESLQQQMKTKYEKEIISIDDELSKKKFELENVKKELSSKGNELLRLQLEAYNYSNVIQSVKKPKLIDLNIIRPNTMPVLLLIVIISAGLSYFIVRAQYSPILNDINSKYDKLLADYAQKSTDFNDLLTHYNLINGPKTSFLSVKDLNITLTTNRDIYSYKDPISVSVKITRLDKTFIGKVSFKLTMNDNVVTGYQHEIENEVNVTIPTPAFRWGPGNYTLQLDSIMDTSNFIIAAGEPLNNTAILIEAK